MLQVEADGLILLVLVALQGGAEDVLGVREVGAVVAVLLRNIPRLEPIAVHRHPGNHAAVC